MRFLIAVFLLLFGTVLMISIWGTVLGILFSAAIAYAAFRYYTTVGLD